MAGNSTFCPKCFDNTVSEGYVSHWERRRCPGCGTRFSVLGKDRPWPADNGSASQQRDILMVCLRRLGVTVREISELAGLSENYVGQITKHGVE